MLVESELDKLGPSNEPKYGCSIACNTKNVWRAIYTRNFDLLKTLVEDKKNIHSLNKPWSVDVTLAPVQYILMKNDLDLLKILYPEAKELKSGKSLLQSNEYKELLGRSLYENRVKPKEYLMNTINTGTVSNKAYGTAIRAV